VTTTREPRVICPDAPIGGEVCGCEPCIITRLMSTSPTRPMDPARLAELAEQSRTWEDTK
jgi:hypothetical protein